MSHVGEGGRALDAQDAGYVRGRQQIVAREVRLSEEPLPNRRQRQPRADGSLVVVPEKSEEARPQSDADDAAQVGDPEMLAAHRAESREIELGFQAPIPEW